MREEVSANERVLAGYNIMRFKPIGRKRNRCASVALRFVEAAASVLIALLYIFPAEAWAQTKLDAQVVSAWSGGSNLQLVATAGGTVILGEGILARKDVGIIAATCEGGYRLRARTSFFEPRAPLVQLADGRWLLDAGPGKYLIELTPHDPTEDDAEAVLVIGQPDQPPPDVPTPDEPSPLLPADAFNNIGRRVAFFSSQMPPEERIRYHQAYSSVADQMESFELKSIRAAREYIARQPLTCSDPRICRELNDILSAEASRLGSVGWRTAIEFYRAVAAGFAPPPRGAR